jgi:hypothetical protein
MQVRPQGREFQNGKIPLGTCISLMTTAGKMILGRLEERAEQPGPPLRQAAAGGRGNSALLSRQGALDRQVRPVFPEPDAG